MSLRMIVPNVTDVFVRCDGRGRPLRATLDVPRGYDEHVTHLRVQLPAGFRIGTFNGVRWLVSPDGAVSKPELMRSGDGATGIRFNYVNRTVEIPCRELRPTTAAPRTAAAAGW
ncbi:MAG: hypothetical protein UHD09_07110 [Bifidobacterium sp.]|nr:hypothetical protein [Bifidobacterium sp.]